MKFKLLVTICALLIISTQGFSQASEKKINKSSAKDLIFEAEKSANYLEGDYSLSENKVAEYLEHYELLERNIKEIPKIDPKWKLDRYKTILLNETKQYIIIANKREFSKWESYYGNKKNKFDNQTDGQGFYDYVVGTDTASLQWAEIQANFVETAKVIAFYYEGEKPHTSNTIWDYKFFNPEAITTAYEKIEYTYLKKIEYLLKRINRQNYDKFEAITSNDHLKKFNELQQDKLRVKAYLFMEPDLSQLKEAFNTIEDAELKIISNLKSKNLSEFHIANFGKIFFSDHKIIPGQETIEDFKTDFKAGEPIYVTYYMFSQIESDDNIRSFTLFYQESGNSAKVYPTPYSNQPNEIDPISVYQFTLLPASDDKSLSLRHKSQLQHAAYHLARKAADGVTEFSLNNFDFAIDFSNDGIAKIQDQHKSLFKAQKQFITLPKAGMTDGSVDAAIRKEFRDSKDEKMAKTKIIKTIIISKNMEYKRNKYSSRIEKRVLREVAVICKDENGDCYMHHAEFIQSKTPTGYGATGMIFSSSYYSDGIAIFANSDRRFYFDCSKL